jgi:hypothetical protein
MVEFRNDLMRQASFAQAGKDARQNGVYIPNGSISDDLNAMRAKQNKPKKRFPWMTVMTIGSIIPFLFTGIGSGGGSSVQSNLQNPQKKQATQAISAMKTLAPNQTAKVSVTIGGQTFEKELSASDLEAAMKNGGMPQ